MDELNALIGVLESEWDPEDAKFTGLQLNGLSQIAIEHGRGSEVYDTAAQTLKAIFSHVSRCPLYSPYIMVLLKLLQYGF